MGRRRRHKATRRIEPRVAKEPKSPEAEDLNRQRIHWSFECFDKYRWYGRDYKPAYFTDIADHLKSFEACTWGQVVSNRPREHFIPAADLCSEARRRLQSLKAADADPLFRFRFDAKRRLWGIKRAETFYVLWWDPEHRVCPGKKR